MKVNFPPHPIPGKKKARTIHDLPADEVISALRKEIRHGHTGNAARLGYKLLMTSLELEEKMWKHLAVISIGPNEEIKPERGEEQYRQGEKNMITIALAGTDAVA